MSNEIREIFWSEKDWTTTRHNGRIKHEWNGYIIVREPRSYQWWVIQGDPAPYKDKFEYINDAKLACEVAFKNEH